MATPFHMIWFSTFAPRNWDLPDSENYHWCKPHTYHEMAHLLETRGKFDALVFADSDGIPTMYAGSTDSYVKYGLEVVGANDPLPMFSALAASTKHLGLIPTMSTSFLPPKMVAQNMGTLDHMSAGRAGWNIVTSIGDYNAKNYGLDDVMSSNARYDRADEFVEEVEALWANASADGSGEGLAMPALPQGKPVVMQAGGSDRGRQFAARHAEIIIAHILTVEAAKSFRDDLRRRMVAVGRDPDSCKVFFTVKPVIAATRGEAEALYEAQKRRPALSVESGLVNFASRVGYDVSKLPLDEPVPEDLPIQGSTGQFQQHFEQGRKPTLREIGKREAVKESFLALGTAAEVADQLAVAMEEIGGDGFAIRETLAPSNVIPVLDLLVPRLQELGLVRSQYRYPTFRENLLDPEFNSLAMPSATAQGM